LGIGIEVRASFISVTKSVNDKRQPQSPVKRPFKRQEAETKPKTEAKPKLLHTPRSTNTAKRALEWQTNHIPQNPWPGTCFIGLVNA